MNARTEALLDPPFAKDPPVKLNISAKTLGLIYAILAALGAVFSLLAIPLLLSISALGAAAGAPGVPALALLGTIINAAAEILVAWGGYQMYQLQREGKKLVIYGLGIAAVGNVLSAVGGLSASSLIGLIVGLGILFVLYYLVVISRFPGDPPLVPSGDVRPTAGPRV